MKHLKALILTFIILCASTSLYAVPRSKDFQPLCDSLRVWMFQRMGVDQKLSVTRVRTNGKTLNLYFSSDLSFYPWREKDVDWFKATLLQEWDSVASGYQLGSIYTNRYELSQLVVPEIDNTGEPSRDYPRRIDDPRTDNIPLVTRLESRHYPLGLQGRHIALWQSHGRYFNEDQGIWIWQRATLHRTVEDMFTQSFVLPYLIPMLENAGAYTMTPRERDLQVREIITDNDPAFSGPRDGLIRREGSYSESGAWESIPEGFADFKRQYTFEDLPFSAGTARTAQCSAQASATATWTPTIEERGRYAVYVSYKTLENSSEAAQYKVYHMGGVSHFSVNQKRGGGTWIYLGTFEFDKGTEGRVTLSNMGAEGECVCADAVKIGGGMGKLERGGSTSGVASSMEGAHYWMQWAGASEDITRNWETDYTNDFAARGLWTTMMKEQKNIPFDLSFAFHSDAGVTQKDSTVGTLAIYTLRNDGEREFEDGRDRIISRLYTDYVQTQVVDDIRSDFNPLWNRRGLWDKSYSESRTTGVPGMILELLSHQNFEDMKYGLDPAFRFTVSRAVYKGILKTLSEFYGCSYQVQPLPVHAFSSIIEGSQIKLSWEPTDDPKEPTATSDGYIVYTKIDDGSFDQGIEVRNNHFELDYTPGHIYSFKVEAYNDGGKSFPSEILSVGVPQGADASKAVLIVNNFNRVGPPAWIDGDQYAGFESREDSGVPYLSEIAYIGDNYEFRRDRQYIDDHYPGFGASYDNHAGEIIAGNSFDYPATHGKALFALGRAFYSSSSEAFCNMEVEAEVLDLICGKQGRSQNMGARDYAVFPDQMRSSLDRFARAGGNIIISGANIASDCTEAEAAFASSLFGYKLANSYGTSSGRIGDMDFAQKPNSMVYCAEHPDGLNPASKSASIWLRYPGSAFGAAITHNGYYSKTVSIGVPIETILSPEDRIEVFRYALEFFER